MKAGFIKVYRNVFFVLSIFMCFILVLSALLLISRYSTSLHSQAMAHVSNYAADTTHILDKGMSKTLYEVEHLANRVSQCDTKQNFIETIDEVKSMPDYSDVVTIRYFKDGIEYNEIGEQYFQRENEKVALCVKENKPMTIGIVYDYEYCVQSIAFCAPVKGSELIDSLVVFFPVSKVAEFFDAADKELLEYSTFSALCASSGEILRTLKSDIDDVHDHENAITYLSQRIYDNLIIDEIRDRIDSGESDVFLVTIDSQTYVCSIGTSPHGGGVFVIGLYLASNSYVAGYEIINTVLSTVVIIFIVLICVLIYVMVMRYINRRKIEALEFINPMLECYTTAGFKKKAADILKRNKGSSFVVIATEIKFYDYICEYYGMQTGEEILKYLKTILEKSMVHEECFGYVSDAQFLILLHCGDSQVLENRLNTLAWLARNYKLKDDKYSVKLRYGIYEVEPSKEEHVQTMIDKAISAKNATLVMGSKNIIRYYSDSIRESYLLRADVESRADDALENDEFVIFFQPKLDLARNRIDSCEALVRWYEPETQIYRRPADFLPIFEANGFIVKLDKLVYSKACRYISESIERKMHVVPVAVNVSRVTATQPDFIEYYTKLKEQYRIPDKYLTLEFTESFAYENYDVLNEVITELHKKGFLCSIDDFGSGHSSYNILKKMNMDEIKLDHFFIERGMSPEKDRMILEHIITTAKTLGMKVIQEGVEKEEDMKLLKQLGCDVLQGYYYSEPLQMVDYIAFLNAHF